MAGSREISFRERRKISSACRRRGIVLPPHPVAVSYFFDAGARPCQKRVIFLPRGAGVLVI